MSDETVSTEANPVYDVVFGRLDYETLEQMFQPQRWFIQIQSSISQPYIMIDCI